MASSHDGSQDSTHIRRLCGAARRREALRAEGPPALVVKVISPSSRKYDRVTKAERYLALGVEHYWIIDPTAKHVVCQRAEGGEWVVVAEGRDKDLWRPRSG